MTAPSLARPASAIDQTAYQNYLRVRDEVGRMKAAAARTAGADAPSEYWSEELSAIDYVSEASPLIIRKLRHHAVHITGLRPYDYRRFGDRQPQFERRLEALAQLAGGRDLLVPEAEALGGFGYSIDGRLYNVDTIKFFEVLVGMHRGGVLDAFRSGKPWRQDSRRMVWEIGGGWGGFAYQFKTLFPNTTYVIVDFAEMFLFSATYLSTLFPHAAIAFWREDQPAFEQWPDADFIFIPHDRAEALHQSRPDLCVNLVSFHEMTSNQVDAYAGHAAAAGCPAIYSLNRDRSVYNDEIDSVGHILSRYYDLREVRLLGSDYTKATKKDSAIGVEEGRVEYEGAGRYRHLVGMLRERRMGNEGGPLSAQRTAEPRTRGDIDTRNSPRLSASAVRVGIGVTLHNRAVYLCEALDSLLAQSYPHFRLVLVDDGSTDATEAMARVYERRDPRVRYVRFDERRGMIAAWRAAFELATAEGVEYFAWASDHDRWDPYWLETLVEELERHPGVVLAYPLTERMDASGMTLPKTARRFETMGLTDLAARWRRFSRSDAVAAGDMVYGLMRPEAARRAGIFREVLCPDRLLLAELTIQGQIRQVPKVLWFRRQFSTGSVARQRSSLFASGVKPPGVMTPPWYMHARALWATYGSGPAKAGLHAGAEAGLHAGAEPGRHDPIALPRATAARLVARYAASYAFRHYAKTPTQRDLVWLLHRPRWVYKKSKHGLLAGVYAALVFARRIGITPVIERMCERLTGRPRPWRPTA